MFSWLRFKSLVFVPVSLRLFDSVLDVGVAGADTTLLPVVVCGAVVLGVVGALETVFICSIAPLVGVLGCEETVVTLCWVLPMGEDMARGVVLVFVEVPTALRDDCGEAVRFPPAAAFIMEAMAKMGF